MITQLKQPELDAHCTQCGACCAAFRVSFYWAESDVHPQGQVPQMLTVPVNPHYVCMKGTEQKPVRCVALTGEVGQAVSCAIYHQRSSTCREFTAGSVECAKARAIYGLEPI